MSGVSQKIDRVGVVFDDESLVADAGLLAAATLMGRLGLEALVDEVVRLGGRPGGANPCRKTLTLVASMLAGGSHIDHVGRLRSGSTTKVLGFEVMAPATVGTFLRSFTWGHVRQLDKAVTATLGRAWEAGAGPGGGPLTVDLDSTICPVSGKGKQGASFGYTKALGYHPLVATQGLVTVPSLGIDGGYGPVLRYPACYPPPSFPVGVGFHVLGGHHSQQTQGVGLLSVQLRVLDRFDDRQGVGYQAVDQLRTGISISPVTRRFRLRVVIMGHQPKTGHLRYQTTATPDLR